MLGNKRAKTTRMRGSSSHGGGHKKKRRGSGHRGGFGMAGSGARGDQKKSMILTKYGKSYFGKRGFKSLDAKSNVVLSLTYLENNFDKLVGAGIIVKEGTNYVFDSTAYKYDKILGNGLFSKKMTIICKEISQTARAKVEGAGGKIVLTASSEDDFEEDSSEE